MTSNETDDAAQQRFKTDDADSYDAVVEHRPIAHSGPWGMATLEVCLAIMQSARERKEIYLQHQVKAPETEPVPS